ncbi:MAG: 30S ribosomal protein S17e [Halobacteria archaeon]
MGAVKSVAIKSLSRALLKEFPDRFTDDLEANKKEVSALTTITSKNVRNRVAGYVTVLRKQAARKSAAI